MSQNLNILKGFWDLCLSHFGDTGDPVGTLSVRFRSQRGPEKCIETGENEKCPETGENKKCVETEEIAGEKGLEIDTKFFPLS